MLATVTSCIVSGLHLVSAVAHVVRPLLRPLRNIVDLDFARASRPLEWEDRLGPNGRELRRPPQRLDRDLLLGNGEVERLGRKLRDWTGERSQERREEDKEVDQH